MENKRTIITLNIIYFTGVFCVLALVAVAVFSLNALDASVNNLLSRPLSPLEEILVRLTANSSPPPFGILYIHRRIPFVLAVGTIPMIIACIFFYRLNGINKSKYKLWKFNLIFLPTYVCIFSLWFVVHNIVVSWAFRNFF